MDGNMVVRAPAGVRRVAPERLVAILDASPDVLLLADPEGRLVWVNAAASRMAGWSVDELLGTPVRDHLDLGDLTTLDRAWAALIAGEDLPGHYEVGIRHADGASIPVRVSIANLLDDPEVRGVVITCRDLRGEVAGRDELRAVVGTLQEGLLVVDHQGQIVDASPSALELFGLRPSDSIAGRDLTGLVSDRVTDEQGRPVTAGHLFSQAADQGLEVTGVVRGYRHPDGSRRWLSVTTRLLEDREPAGVAISIVDVTDRYDAEQQLRNQVRRDALTGLPNRVELAERLHEVLEARSAGLAVLFLDLDGFKAVNDEHGHQAGDAVLRHTARRLQAAVRPGDLVVRYGGDEFVVVCLLCDVPDAALAVADRVRSAVAEPCRVDCGEVAVQASVGIAWVDSTRNGIDASAVLQAADLALYRVKQDNPGGREMVVIRF